MWITKEISKESDKVMSQSSKYKIEQERIKFKVNVDPLGVKFEIWYCFTFLNMSKDHFKPVTQYSNF